MWIQSFVLRQFINEVHISLLDKQTTQGDNFTKQLVFVGRQSQHLVYECLAQSILKDMNHISLVVFSNTQDPFSISLLM